MRTHNENLHEEKKEKEKHTQKRNKMILFIRFDLEEIKLLLYVVELISKQQILLLIHHLFDVIIFLE